MVVAVFRAKVLEVRFLRAFYLVVNAPQELLTLRTRASTRERCRVYLELAAATPTEAARGLAMLTKLAG